MLKSAGLAVALVFLAILQAGAAQADPAMDPGLQRFHDT